MNPLTQEIRDLAESVSALAHRAVKEYTPVVDAIVGSRSRDTHHIEHTLDGLLDFCFHPDALVLFKKLCRHYYFIDAAAAARYVYVYRDMWDSDVRRAAAHVKRAIRDQYQAWHAKWTNPTDESRLPDRRYRRPARAAR
jgi:hypothetical protein